MKLQERDYTIFLNDDERAAFELEERIAKRKGVNFFGIKDRYILIIIYTYWNIKS